MVTLLSQLGLLVCLSTLWCHLWWRTSFLKSHTRACLCRWESALLEPPDTPCTLHPGHSCGGTRPTGELRANQKYRGAAREGTLAHWRRQELVNKFFLRGRLSATLCSWELFLGQQQLPPLHSHSPCLSPYTCLLTTLPMEAFLAS